MCVNGYAITNDFVDEFSRISYGLGLGIYLIESDRENPNYHTPSAVLDK